MSGVLIIPRVEVFWGSDNLTHYGPSASWTPEGVPQPLVYDCSAKQAEEGEMPSGRMKWVPSGPAFEVYQKFISSEAKMKETIVMRFFYPNGRSVSFQFVWSGQRFIYGIQQEIEVQLASELEGMFNSVTRNTSQAHVEEPVTFKQAISETEKQFVVEGAMQYSPQAEKDVGQAKLDKTYAEDVTFASAAKNILEQNGNMVMANAIGGKPSMVAFTPYGTDEEPINEPSGEIQPNLRYGYFIGPSIYSTIERSYEWKAPQLSTGSQGDFQTKVTPVDGKATKGTASWYGGKFIGRRTANGEIYTAKELTAAHKSLPFGTQLKVTNLNNGKSTVVRVNDRGPFVAGRDLDLSQAAAAQIGMLGTGVAPISMQVLGKPAIDTAEKKKQPTTAPIGTQGGKASPDVSSVENPMGPVKQEAGKEERQSNFSMSTLMVPALVGIKPHDILFIPDFKGTFIEDWIVRSVEYSQKGGAIELSIQAARSYASGTLMNKNSEIWLEKARGLGLVGENVSMENWEKYAWKLGETASSPGTATRSIGEIGGATTLKGLTDSSRKILNNSPVTEKGLSIPLPPDIG
jgi:rare lipoprotein A (peptidoglycan hydrolase)